MFLGEYQHTLDAKGRVSLPAKFRMQLGDQKIVVAKGVDNELWVYTLEQYQEFIQELSQRADFDGTLRKVRRFFTAGAMETSLDSAGRISLPAQWREWAGLTKDVAVIGNDKRIELWDAERWSAYNSDAGDAIEDLTQELAQAGLL